MAMPTGSAGFHAQKHQAAKVTQKLRVGDGVQRPIDQGQGVSSCGQLLIADIIRERAQVELTTGIDRIVELTGAAIKERCMPVATDSSMPPAPSALIRSADNFSRSSASLSGEPGW